MKHILIEPIYKSILCINMQDAYELVGKLSEKYTVKNRNMGKGIIVLDASCYVNLLFTGAWVKEIVVKVRPISQKETELSIYGVLAIFPFDLLNITQLQNRKVDLSQFSDFAKSMCSKYECAKDRVTLTTISSKQRRIFWILEISSVFVIVILFSNIFSQNSNQLYTMGLIALFIVTQSSLVLWLTKDCSSRTYLSYATQRKWKILIAFTGFVGSLFYYLSILSKSDG